MAEDSVPGLTVREVATMSGLHVQTVRRYIRDGELPATRTQGSHGPEWRVAREDAESLARAQRTESAHGEPDLSRTHSMLAEIAARLTAIGEGQRALVPAPEELAERADREDRIARALEAGPDLRALAEDLGRVTAERDALADELCRARATIDDLQADRRRGWWHRLLSGR